MHCPLCGNKLSDKATECSQCKKPLTGYDPGPEFACPHCRKNIAEDANYCWSCGSEIEKAKGEIRGVGGWLLLFSISLLIINPLVLISGCISDYRDSIQYVAVIPGIVPFLVFTITVRVVMAVYCVYAGISLFRIAPDAVRTAKICLISLLISSVIVNFSPNVFLRLPPDTLGEMNMDALKNTLRSIVYCLIWYLYLMKSRRVKNTFGISARIKAAGTPADVR